MAKGRPNQSQRARGGRAAARAASDKRSRAPASARTRRSGGSRRRATAARPRRSLLGRVVRYGFVLALWGFVAVAGLVGYLAWDMPATGDMAPVERRPAVTILAEGGERITRQGDVQGHTLAYEELPPHLVQAVVAIEDRRFFDHSGVDPWGIARAFVANIRAWDTVQGGSTITQQLAKILFLSPERTLKRKVQEALLAVWLETNYPKEEILSAYLNRVYLGAGTYGVDAAARVYFGVSARDVSLAQAAVLAGLLRAPSRYAPTSAPELAEARARVVLGSMVDEGYITQAQAEAAGTLPPLANATPAGGRPGLHFADWVAGQVPDYVGYRPQDLVVRTTLDAELQGLAERVVRQHMAGEGRERGASQAALVAMRHDGAVVAMVGGVSYPASPFNRAVDAWRQPGSAFKPVVYLAALEGGLWPDAVIEDAPVRFGNWEPRNFNGRYEGPVTVSEGLARSLNTVAARVLSIAGVDAAIDMGHRLGLTGTLRREMALALGASEVTLLELTGAYASFANGGQGVIPYGIQTIASDRLGAGTGETVYLRRGGGLGRAVQPALARQLTGMLHRAVEEGTGRNAAIGRPAAGKTGTSQDYRDAWFVGFTADYVVGVWVGNDDGRPMDEVTGGGLPARIWHDFMAEASAGLPVRPLPGASDLVARAPEAPAAPSPAAGPPIDLLGGLREASTAAEEADREGLDALIESVSQN